MPIRFISDLPGKPIIFRPSPSSKILIDPDNDGSMLIFVKWGVVLAFSNIFDLSDWDACIKALLFNILNKDFNKE